VNAIIGIGAGAGFVSALLFAVVVTGNPLAILLYAVAPLPVLLASLGWNHRAGLVATAVGALCIALVAPSGGLVFAVTVALPAWWVSYLLLLARPENGTVEWYPLGRLLAWIAGLSAAITLLVAVLVGDGSYASFVHTFERAALRLNDIRPGIFEGLAPGEMESEIAALGRLLAVAAPPISSALSVLISAILLYGAARIVSASGRLPRPWAGIGQIRLPPVLVPVLVVAGVLGLVLNGFAALGLRSVAASLLMAFCLQGLAVIHVLTQGVVGRGGILTGVYFIFVLLPGWPVLLYALVGLVDAFLDLRARRAGAAGPPVPPSA
jgi:hypothetical protein